MNAAPIATMRRRVPKKKSQDYYKKKTLAKRVRFKWLPVFFVNDLVHGSWWFVWASILAMLIPIPVVINFYLQHHNQFWEVAYQYLITLPDHTAVYIVLVGCGIFFTIGSYFLVRGFTEPHLKPLFPCMFCQTDEVAASWFYFLGIVPTIPICVIYLHYLPSQSTLYGGAILVCGVSSLVMLLFTFAVYPNPDGKPKVEVFTPWIHRCCCGVNSSWHVHFQTDWLLICWLCLVGSLFATIASAAALFWYCYLNEPNEIYNYATGLLDMIMIVIGCAYYVAGSYPSDHVSDDEDEEDDEDDSDKDSDDEEANSSSVSSTPPAAPRSYRQASVESVSSKSSRDSNVHTQQVQRPTRPPAPARLPTPRTVPATANAKSTIPSTSGTRPGPVASPSVANKAEDGLGLGVGVEGSDDEHTGESALSALRAKRNSRIAKGAAAAMWQDEESPEPTPIPSPPATAAAGAASHPSIIAALDDDEDDDEWQPEGNIPMQPIPSGKSLGRNAVNTTTVTAAAAAGKPAVPTPAHDDDEIDEYNDDSREERNDEDEDDEDEDDNANPSHTPPTQPNVEAKTGAGTRPNQQQRSVPSPSSSSSSPSLTAVNLTHNAASSAASPAVPSPSPFDSLPSHFIVNKLPPPPPRTTTNGANTSASTTKERERDVDGTSEDSYGIARQQIPRVGISSTNTNTVTANQSNSLHTTGSSNPSHPSSSLPFPSSSSFPSSQPYSSTLSDIPENPFASPSSPPQHQHPLTGRSRSSSPTPSNGSTRSAASARSAGSSHVSARFGPKPPNPFDD